MPVNPTTKRRQFAFRQAGPMYAIGLIREDGQWVEIAQAYQHAWANDITVALNHHDFVQTEEETEPRCPWCPETVTRKSK